MDLSHTIVPKSNQLNADDLLAGDITITVTDISASDSPDQPVSIHYSDDNGRPYKPCKSMRRVLIQAWGANGKDWIGKSMTLYRDPAVKFGGSEVGGIRISHLSDIERDMSFMLTVTRAKRQAYSVKKLVDEKPKPDFEATFDRIVGSVVNGSNTIDGIVKFFADRGAALTEAQIDRLNKAVTPERETESDPDPALTTQTESDTEEPDIF